MNGLPANIAHCILRNYQRSVLLKLTAQQLFDDAMYLLESEIGDENCSEETRCLFRMAAKKGHSEAEWISPVLDKCNGKLDLILSSFGSLENNDKGQYFVWLKTKEEACLIRASATNWNVAYAAFLMQKKPFPDNVILEWMNAHGDRNSNYRFQLSLPIESWRAYSRSMSQLPVMSQHPLYRMCTLQKKPAKWKDICLSMCFTGKISRRVAERIVTHSHLLSTFSKRHEVSMYDFGRALNYLGFAAQNFYSELNKQFEAKYPKMGLDAAKIMSHAYHIWETAFRERRRAIVAAILVCKYNGCNRDLQKLIGQLIREMSGTNWIQAGDEPSVKRLKRSEV